MFGSDGKALVQLAEFDRVIIAMIGTLSHLLEAFLVANFSITKNYHNVLIFQELNANMIA